jgi:hypothetical protein
MIIGIYCAQCALPSFSDSLFKMSYSASDSSECSVDLWDCTGLREVASQYVNGYLFCHLNVRSLYRCIDQLNDLITSVDGNRVFL